jgi:hypothetical protein
MPPKHSALKVLQRIRSDAVVAASRFDPAPAGRACGDALNVIPGGRRIRAAY